MKRLIKPDKTNISWSISPISEPTTVVTRGGSRTAATSKEELFVIIANGFKPLTIITKSSSLDAAAVLDPPLVTIFQNLIFCQCFLPQ